MKNVKREHWSGKLAFVLAAAGSAVGLGNLWKFPYITWDNGGGVFIAIYLICIVAIGLPMLITEIGMGKISQKSAVGSFNALSKGPTFLKKAGLLGVFSSFLLLSFYSVIGGWSLNYITLAFNDSFRQVPVEQEQKMLKDPEVTASLYKKALENGLSSKLTAEEKKLLLEDAEVSLPENPELLDETFATSLQSLPNSLDMKGHSEKWGKYFYKNYSQKSDWLNKALLPHFSVNLFVDFLGDTPKKIFWHTLFMLLTTLVVLGGIRGGIEKSARLFMPVLFVLILALVVNSLFLDEKGEGVNFLLKGDFSKFNARSILEALGHSFFTLSLGMGTMITYGSYMEGKSNVVGDSMWVVVADTLIALLACLMVFPIIFSYGLKPTSGGIGILFTTLPLEFASFSGGWLLCITFYFLVMLAALTSAISLLEVAVSYFVDELNMPRKKATFLVAITIYLLGVPSAVSMTFLDYADKLVSTILMPLGGMMVALFVGYKVDMKVIQEEFANNNYPDWSFTVYRFSIKFLTPALVGVVFADQIFGLLKG